MLFDGATEVIESIGTALIALGILVLFVMGARRPHRPSPLKLRPPKPPTDKPKLDALSALERLDHQAGTTAARNERTRWLRPFGVFGRLVTYAVLFLLLYAYWPTDISHRPLASLTLSDLFGTVAPVGIGIVLIRALFEPSEDDGIKEAWGC
jgi:hypothetical protein